MDVTKALFQQLDSREHEQLSGFVDLKGGRRVLEDNDETLLELEGAAKKASGASKADVGRAGWEKSKDTALSAEELRRDVLEDPNDVMENNLTVFSRKFEVQKNQIDELTLVVQRESDRIIQEVKGGPAR
jgi:hypothetical protein